ncbi:DUF6963 family protein [Spiribacter halobius]|uniref:DUF6963 family protein n=1 Tax=Sediminicurvatus halobius TaxID=2182432 RepID=UPI001304D740|nr:hypothetical protein [Spiribacter halobius]UEX79969.1 hypothetical protein LMH63_16455 [Spiribacter halobius]
MTIGIAASGPRAGLAVYRALAAVERVAEGAIGGFAAFAALDAHGVLHRAATQRGGSRTLFTAGERTGAEPPPAVAEAPFAALMSSGPDRPEPLAQFVPAARGAGLVTGHRLPNAAGRAGRPLNRLVLEALEEGAGAREAVEAVLAAEPEADAGLIALDLRGGLHAANSARVGRRRDLGHALRAAGGAQVAVLHNAIRPVGSLAALAAEIALGVLCPPPAPAGRVCVRAGTPLRPGKEPRVLVDAGGRAVAVETPDERLLAGRHNCAALYLDAAVVQEGQLLGRLAFEPNVMVEDGRIVSLSGQEEMHVDYIVAEDGDG